MSAEPVPDAWPLLLTRELAAAYLRISEDTFGRICPVPPLDLGVNLLRWRRPEIDAWIAGLPARLRRAQAEAQDAVLPPPAPVTPADERREGALARAAERSRCQKKSPSPSSSASRAPAAA